MVEVLRAKVAGELGGAPHQEGHAGVIPRDGVVSAGVLHHAYVFVRNAGVTLAIG